MSASADISKFLAAQARRSARARAAAVKAVNVFGEHVIGDAQQLTPVDTGALQASATTLPAEVDGDNVTKVIGFNTSYAAAVHERTETAAGKPIKHKVGQAKYLETAVRENAEKFAPFVAGKVKAALESEGG